MGRPDPAPLATQSTAIWRYGVLTAAILGSLIWALSLNPIPQDIEYHSFADSRIFAGIPNFFDVMSNLPFLIVGLFGVQFCHRSKLGAVGRAWLVLFVGVAFVSAGSAYYHWNPTNQSLVWDRIPMTMAFMGLFVSLLGEYLGYRLAAILLVPAVLLGIATVLYWALFDDLRLYYWVQLAPLLTIPAAMMLFRSRYTHDWLLLVALGCYALAKVAEVYDQAIFRATSEVVSGHTLKHLLAAAGCYTVLWMLQSRNPRQELAADRS